MPETSTDNIENVDVDEPMQVSLSTNAAPDELLNRWQSLRQLTDKTGQQTAEAYELWEEATDPMARAHLWDEYEAQSREFRVLAAWRELFYTAFIFTTDGADCAALDDSSFLS